MVACRTPVSAGRPVRGSIRWWIPGPQLLMVTEEVASAPRSMCSRRISSRGSKGSSTPIGRPPRRWSTDDPQVTARVNEAPGEQPLHPPRRLVHGPTLGDAAEIERDVGGQPDAPVVGLDLLPSTAGLRWMKDQSGPGDHFVEVAVVSDGQQSREHRRIEQAVRDPCGLQSQVQHLEERRRYRRPRPGGGIHQRYLGPLPEPAEPLVLSNEGPLDDLERLVGSSPSLSTLRDRRDERYRRSHASEGSPLGRGLRLLSSLDVIWRVAQVPFSRFHSRRLRRRAQFPAHRSRRNFHPSAGGAATGQLRERRASEPDGPRRRRESSASPSCGS